LNWTKNFRPAYCIFILEILCTGQTINCVIIEPDKNLCPAYCIAFLFSKYCRPDETLISKFNRRNMVSSFIKKKFVQPTVLRFYFRNTVDRTKGQMKVRWTKHLYFARGPIMSIFVCGTGSMRPWNEHPDKKIIRPIVFPLFYFVFIFVRSTDFPGQTIFFLPHPTQSDQIRTRLIYKGLTSDEGQKLEGFKWRANCGKDGLMQEIAEVSLVSNSSWGADEINHSLLATKEWLPSGKS